MQTNDLNRLVGYENDQDLGNLLVSAGRTWGRSSFIDSKEQVLKQKTVIDEDFLRKVRKDVEKFQALGKSRRWIKRWVKRKYNIIEY